MIDVNVKDKVVCINDDFPAWAKATYNALPVKGQIYTLRHIDLGLNTETRDAHLIPLGSSEDKEKWSDPPNNGSYRSRDTRNFKGYPTVMVLLEEIHNDIHQSSKKEPGFKLARFAPLEKVSEQEKIVQNIKIPNKLVKVKSPKKPVSV